MYPHNFMWILFSHPSHHRRKGSGQHHTLTLELQTEALHKAGCMKIFEDRVSGSRAERPGLAQARESLREGDTLVVWKLDRLGRGVTDLRRAEWGGLPTFG